MCFSGIEVDGISICSSGIELNRSGQNWRNCQALFAYFDFLFFSFPLLLLLFLPLPLPLH